MEIAFCGNQVAIMGTLRCLVCHVFTVRALNADWQTKNKDVLHVKKVRVDVSLKGSVCV